MTTYGFTLHVEGMPESDQGLMDFANALFEHAPDSTPGAMTIGFDRESNSLREAIRSAIESVRRADPSVSVVGIVLDDGQLIDELVGTTAA